MEGEQPRCAIGVLTKWVNYGKGWRKRVVCLEPGGVLTYFTLNKVNLPLLAEAHHGCVDWIGSEVSTLLGSQKARYVQNEVLRHEAQGTVSLSVASVRKSRNESKKFYVDTGTSVLQFYAQGADERQAWLAVLDGRSGNPPLRTARSRAVAQMFSRLRSQGQMSADACEEVSSHIRALQARLRTERRERKRLACSRGYRRSARSASASARRSEEGSRRRSMADRLGEGACKAHEARERPGPFM